MFKNIILRIFLVSTLFLLIGCSKKSIIENELNQLILPKETKYSIELPQSSPLLKLEIIWESSDESILDVLGNVYSTKEEKEIILTANIEDIKKEFKIKILKNDNEYYPYFDQAFEQIRATLPEELINNIKLKEYLLEYPELNVKYYSNKEKFLNANGTVNRDLNEDKVVKFYVKLTHKSNSRIFMKEIVVKKVSDEEKIKEAREFVQQYIKENNFKEILNLPLKSEKYNVDLKWSSLDFNLVNNDGSINKTFDQVSTKLVCDFKSGELSEKITINYKSIIMNKAEREQYIEILLNQYYSKEQFEYVSILHNADLYIRQGIVSLSAPNRPGKIKPTPSSSKINEAGYSSIPNKDNVLWIVIHDTGNTNANADASAHNNFINNKPSTNVSWHYTVDDKSIYQHIPDNEIAYHAGDSTSIIGNGNNNGIGIEMCVNKDGDFELTLRHTAKLVARLLIKYNLKLSSVKQHHYFSGKNCPATLRQTNRWVEFLEMISLEYSILSIATKKENIKNTVSPLKTTYNTVFQVLKTGSYAEKVTLEVAINLDDFKKSFKYILNLKK